MVSEIMFALLVSHDETLAFLTDACGCADKVLEGMSLPCWKSHWPCSGGQSPVTGCNKLVPSGAAVLVQRDVPEMQTRLPAAGGFCHLTVL